MPSEAANAIAYVGAFVGLIGGGVALFNSRQAVLWKRAELANSYLKDFQSNSELVFASRCLDWNAGKLVLPEGLRPYIKDSEYIDHDRRVFANALRPDLLISEMDDDPRIQIYRVAIDSFLSWLCLVSSALDRRLFNVRDIEEVGYWTAKLQSETAVHAFIRAFGYQENIDNLTRRFRKERGAYRHWWFQSNRAR